MNVPLILAILRYIPLAVIDLAADLLAVVLSPIAALPIFISLDANGRERIHFLWRWITTHDEYIDLYVHHEKGQSEHWFLRRFTPEQIKRSGWLRYYARIAWIFRNPAYRVSHWLGYDQRGVQMPADGFDDPRWDSGWPNSAFWAVRNASGRVGFLFQAQWYYWGQRCVEVQFGWKLYRSDPDQRCMLAFRIIPFKKYERTDASPVAAE